MQKLLSDKRAVVTGGNRGLGLAIAMGLANDGAQVLVAGRVEDGCASVAGRIRDLGGVAGHVVADIADPESAPRVIDAALEAFGGVDILVNNAGVFLWKNVLDVTREDFEMTLAVNLAAPFYLSQAAARAMIQQGTGGSIINMASIHGKVGDPNVVPHCGAKFGLIGITKSMAEALRPHRIRVNAICPGAIEADSADRRSTSPMDMVTQADIATLAVFLASDLGNAMTGAAVDMPGNTHTEIKIG